MVTRFPVSVRINDGRTDRHITQRVRNLRWTKSAPGGFQGCSFVANLDPGIFTDLGAADRVWIYGPTGRTIWEGFIDNPGRVDDGGVGLELTAMGTTILASDRAEALPYRDMDVSSWEPYQKNLAYGSASVSADPAATTTTTGDGLLTQFNRQAVPQNGVAQIGYTGLAGTAFQLGGFYAVVRSGRNSTDYRSQLAYSGAGSGVGSVDFRADIITTAGPWSLYVGTGFPSGATAAAVRIIRTAAAGSVADDNTWTWWSDVGILGRRMDRFGNLLTGSAGMQSVMGVRADWVAEDLLGRLLTVCDPNAATIDAATFLIDQLAYLDGATAADVLDDLALYEPDFLWEILHHNGTGYVFNYRAWPTTVRYEVSTRDGYDAPGGEFELCNRIAVKWTDQNGGSRVTVVTATSAQYPALKALEDAGRVRDAQTITLPEGRGSAANAQRVGEQTLTAKANPPKAATVTVKRPIVDLLRGGWAMPYEVEPGYLVRVRETGDVLRLTEVEVDDEAGTVTLTLGEPILSEEQRLARLENVARRAA